MMEYIVAIAVTTCPSFERIENGDVVYTVEAGSVTRYLCDDGFTLRGTETRTCQGDGSWSGEAPMCETGLYEQNNNNVQYLKIMFDCC